MQINKEKLRKIFIPLLFFLLFLGPLLKTKIGFLLIVILAGFFVWQYLKGKNNFSSILNNLGASKIIDADKIKNMNPINNVGKKIALIIGVLLLAWLFFASIVIVDAGETGVYSLFGKVSDKELSSGFHLVIPLAKVTKMSIRTEEYTMSIIPSEGNKKGNDAITSLTKEGLSVDLDMTVLYHLEESKASNVYGELGINYDEKIIRPTIRTSIRDIIAQYEAKDIYSIKREEAAQKIQEQLVAQLNSRGIIIEKVLLRNVALPETLSKAIQEKLQVEQEAQKYDFILQREAKEKERKIIEAEGQRDSQKIINESLTTNYLYYSYIKELKDRQGTIYVPTSPTNGMPLFQNVAK
jgi:regulator of protease activity HflC (stomatin/prohibitin superfamily)